MPCRSFGIVGPGGDGLPIVIPPRGDAIHKARRDALRDSALVEAILHGGSVTFSMLASEAQFFSVNALDEFPDERELLLDAFVQAYADRPDVTTTYQRFLATSLWAIEHLEKRPMSTTQLISTGYKEAVEGDCHSEVGFAWAEYELRRRVSFRN